MFCKEELKGYEIFRIALGIVKNNENVWVCYVINHRLVQNLWSGRVLRWRNYHTRTAFAMFPDQDSGKVNIVSPNPSIPGIFN